MFPPFALALKAFIFFVMALAAAHAWCEHHQKLLGVRRLGGPEGFTMGDANVRRPVATRFEHGVDFGLLVHKSPFMADDRDPLVLSNYIFELLEVNPGVAGFLIQLHPDDVDAVVESVTAHAEKGAGTKTTLYVGQEEEEVEEVEEEEEDAGGVGAGGRKEKPHNPLMISVQKVRIRPGKGKGQSDGWFPQPLTHNTRRVCTDDPENKLPMHSLCPTREWEREWYGVTTPNIVSGQGVILFPFGATPPLIGEAEEVVAAEPLGAFNRDPNDLVLTVGGKLVVNHLLEHDFLSAVQLQSLLDDLDRVPLSEKAPIFNENPPIVGRPQDSGTRRTLYGNYGGAHHHRHNPHKLHDLPVLKRVADRVLETAKKTVVGGVGWSCTILDMAEISSYDHTPQHLHRDAPPYTIPEGTLIVNCLIMLTHNHEEEDGSHFLFVPSSSSGFPDPWVERAVPFKRGTAFFFNALDVHRGSGIPKASPTGVSHPRPMALIVCVGSFTGGEFWVESGGLLNPSLREKKRHTRVCKGRAVEGWACTATPQAPVLFNTRALHAPLPREGERWSVIFYSAGGVLHCTPVWRQQLLSMGFRVL